MWNGTVGLVNGQFKYLTAETFGHKINADGVALKKKQLWSIEPFPVTSNGSNGNRSGGSPSLTPQNSIEEMDELENVAIKSHLNCYLAVDNYGNVTCDSTERHDGCRFTITICAMTQEGREEDQISWAFRNVSRGYFLGVSTDSGTIVCNAKMPQSKAELWHVHLIPARGATMFALKSIGRKRYARNIAADSVRSVCNGNQTEQIQIDATNAWGPETLFQFKYFENGSYALIPASSCTKSLKYISSDGTCIEAGGDSPSNGKSNGFTNGQSAAINGQGAVPPKDCLFTIEYHSGCIAFRDKSGRYLAATGRQAVLRTRSVAVGKDELFVFEPAPIQVAFRATFNNKWISFKQGVDLSANQNEVTQQETFQMEYDDKADCWYLSTHDGKFWAPGAASTVQVSSADLAGRGSYRLTWNRDDGTCSLAAIEPNAEPKALCARKSGQLYTGGGEPIKFYMKFMNRTNISLRASNSSGFVGTKGQGSYKLESNKTTPDLFIVEYANGDNLSISREDSDLIDSSFNCCYLKLAATGKYLNVVDGQTLAVDAPSMACAQQFQLELRTGTYIAIRAYDSSAYLNLTANGAIVFGNCLPEKATLWEF